MAEFLAENRSEVSEMLLTECDMKFVMEGIRRDSFQDGFQGGLDQGIKSLIEGFQEAHISREETEQKVREKFSMSEEQVQEKMEQYWKSIS